MARGRLSCVLALCLMGEALSVPLGTPRPRRGYNDNELDSEEASQGDMSSSPIPSSYDHKRKESDTFDDDDDFMESMETAPSTGGGSSIISLLNLVSGLSSGTNVMLRRMVRELVRRYPQTQPFVLRRQDFRDNEIDIDDTFDLKPPPFQRQESDEDESSSSESDSQDSESAEDNAAEESLEDVDNGNNGDSNASQQNSARDDNGGDGDGDGDGDDDNDSDYDDEPPGGGDGQGGGILGILAGLSGDNGESDLGSLLATVSGIVVSLSGDGFDLNSLIASALGLFVGLLSEGEENPGDIIASYLLTSLETITGGGSKNNGKFFGKLVAKLISGTSMGEPPEGASDESGEPEGMKDSAGFIASLLMGLSGDMSKGSSKGSSHPW